MSYRLNASLKEVLSGKAKVRIVDKLVNINTQQDLDSEDWQYILDAICFYDMHGEKDFEEYDGFHHVYGLCKENGAS